MLYSDVVEALLDDDLFLRSYPTFSSYLSAWDVMGGPEASKAHTEAVFAFYAEKIPPESALHTWFTYAK